MTVCAADAILSGSCTSIETEAMPEFALVVASRCDWLRPAIMIWFPRLCSASARPRPMPVQPPVMRIVFPVRIMNEPLFALELAVNVLSLRLWRDCFEDIPILDLPARVHPIE